MLNRRVNVNVEYRDGAVEFVTVVEEDTNVDIGKDLLEEGLVIFKNRTGAHLQPLMKEYAAAQQVRCRCSFYFDLLYYFICSDFDVVRLLLKLSLASKEQARWYLGVRRHFGG